MRVFLPCGVVRFLTFVRNDNAGLDEMFRFAQHDKGDVASVIALHQNEIYDLILIVP